MLRLIKSDIFFYNLFFVSIPVIVFDAKNNLPNRSCRRPDVQPVDEVFRQTRKRPERRTRRRWLEDADQLWDGILLSLDFRVFGSLNSSFLLCIHLKFETGCLCFVCLKLNMSKLGTFIK